MKQKIFPVFMKFSFFVFAFVFFTISPIHYIHANEPIKILIVPGHDDEVWGSQYGDIKEADMNLRLSIELYNIIKKDKRFKVYITRNTNGYTKEFSDYFIEHREEIISFKDEKKKARLEQKTKGEFIEVNGVPHVNVNEEMSIKLYGINKWANENNIDIVLHIHFNDYPRDNKWQKGIHKGFAIYIPERQMKNARNSRYFAEKVFNQLNTKYNVSTYGGEQGGLVEDQTLIALGSNDSLDKEVNSVLVEYGYIYRFGDKNMRHRAYKNMASLTAKGIREYFFNK